VAAAGKAEYPLPMYVNAALNRPGYQPGGYPSGGPLPHLMDVWRTAAPHLDFFAPDIYFPDFTNWCQKYCRNGNPLFIPESRVVPANLFYAIGQCDAMGVSPFGIEDEIPTASATDPLSFDKAYEILTQLEPLILSNRGQGTMAGVVLDETNQTQRITMGDFTLNLAHDYTWKYSSGYHSTNAWPRFGAIIISTAPDEYYVAGNGVIITFDSNSMENPIAGILGIDEGSFVNGKWMAERRLNGDESHQGRHVRLPPEGFSIQHVKLYAYH
jgi:hypothetical protein